MNQKKKYPVILKLAAVLTLLLVTLGCSTIAGWMKVPSQEYVDDKFAQIEGKFGEVEGQVGQVSSDVGAVQEEVGQMKGTLDEFSVTADKLEELLVSFQETMRTTEELSRLAGVLEERLNDLPKETIGQLVEVLQSYLDSQ